MTSKTNLPPSFLSKRQKILARLAVPVTEYDDLSPKGSIDEGIRDLIDEINACEWFVTTSSCAGRVSVFAEGDRSLKSDELLGFGRDETITKPAGIGGKGGGGRWLFVSHEPVDLEQLNIESATSFLGMNHESSSSFPDPFGVECESRLIHFKFEPMILHVLTASSHHAQIILTAALQAGFRESGALNLTPNNTENATPIVAIRSMGLALESIIGHANSRGNWECFVQSTYLWTLLELSNHRFKENTRRIGRFKELLAAGLLAAAGTVPKLNADGSEWEDAETRRERLRAEGLKKSKDLKKGTVTKE